MLKSEILQVGKTKSHRKEISHEREKNRFDSIYKL